MTAFVRINLSRRGCFLRLMATLRLRLPTCPIYEHTFGFQDPFTGARSKPRTPPGDPSVVSVLHPPNRRKLIERSEQGPASAQLVERAVDRRGALEPPAIRLDRPDRAADLLSAQAKPLGQPRLLVRPRFDLAGSIVALDPAREPNSKVALAVVDEDQPVIRHGPKLHCS
jgi:hypothetical protein